DDVARPPDREQPGADHEILARQRLREIPDVDVPHDGEDRLLRPVPNVDLRLEQRPPRPLEKVEHRRMVQMPEHVAVRRVDVERDFGKCRHGARSSRMRESNVNQNRTGSGAASAARSSASANALALYVASSATPVSASRRRAASRPADVSRPYAPPNV